MNLSVVLRFHRGGLFIALCALLNCISRLLITIITLTSFTIAGIRSMLDAVVMAFHLKAGGLSFRVNISVLASGPHVFISPL